MLKSLFSISSFLLVLDITWMTYSVENGNFIGSPFLVVFIFLPLLFIQALFMFIYLTNKNEKNLWVQFGIALFCLVLFAHYLANNSIYW